MPILIEQYEWSESATEVTLSLPLKGVKPSTVDIISTESYLKVSYPPYLFEAHLHDKINDRESNAKVGDGQVKFVMKKQNPGQWGDLRKPTELDSQSQRSGSREVLKKEELKLLREKAIEENRKRAEEAEQLRRERKQEEEREAVRQQIEADDKLRQDRAAARKAAVDGAIVGLDELQQKEKEFAARRETHKQSTPAASSMSAKTSSKKKVKDKEGEKKIPAIRKSATISVTFTPRVFATPMRESKVDEEEEWLKKKNEAAKSQADFAKEHGEFSDKDPLWLKDKGDDFYRQRNFQSAINAYSYALQQGSKLPALFSNRAACHLHLGDCERCVKDCCVALDLLTPPVEDNRKSRVKVLVRRGTALAKLEMLPEALKDYQTALALDPDNTSLQSDEKSIRQKLQGTVD